MRFHVTIGVVQRASAVKKSSRLSPGARGLVQELLTLTQDPDKVARGALEVREHLLQVAIAEVAIHSLADHLAKIGGQGEIAAFVEMLGRQAGPLAIHAAAAHRAAEHEHDVGMAVVGATIAILSRVAPE